MKIILKDCTEPELDVFRNNCNFTDDEMKYFNLRSKGKSNIQISLEMDVSTATVSRLASRVQTKISRINSI